MELVKKNRLDEISIILLYFFPATLVIGPFVSEIFMNLISVFFIFFIFKNKKFDFIKDPFFIIAIIFVIYLLINTFISDYSEVLIKRNLFYFRYIIFIYAISNLISKNNSFLFNFYKFLFLTIFIVVADGYIQYFSGKNILGYGMYRADRISGFFDEDLVIGSYLSKFLPLFIGLFLLNKKKFSKIFNSIALLTIFFTFALILFSGERSAFFVSLMGMTIIILTIDEIKNYRKILIISSSLVLFFFVVINPKIFDRYVHQTLIQLNLETSKLAIQAQKLLPGTPRVINLHENTEGNLFWNFRSHGPYWDTAYKAFKKKKIIGHGVNSFRYFCNNPEYITYFPNRKNVINNETLSFDVGWKIRNVKLIKYLVDINEYIDLNDDFIEYEHKNKSHIFKSNKKGVVLNHKYRIGDTLNPGSITSDIKIIDKNIKKKLDLILYGCSTHPHNYYLQLLSETGLIGFLFIFSIFVYLLFKIINFSIIKLYSGKLKMNDFQICLVVNFIMILWPITTNGNFFNNWITMLTVFPIGFYLYSIKSKKAL